MSRPPNPGLPPGALLLPLVFKPAFYWLFVRGVLTVFGIWAPPLLVSIAVVGVVLALVVADRALLHEHLFFSNLGVSRLRAAALVAGLLELAASVAGRLAT